MESLKAYYNCLCCKEIAKVNPFITSCCSNIICGNCFNKLDKCPLKCQGDKKLTANGNNLYKLFQILNQIVKLDV